MTVSTYWATYIKKWHYEGPASINPSEDLSIYITSGNITTSEKTGFIVGPASIQIGIIPREVLNNDETAIFSVSENHFGGGLLSGDNVLVAELDYAILRAGVSNQSSYVLS